MKQFYKDYCGCYSISEHRDGTATLLCRDSYGRKTFQKDYKSLQGAKIGLSRFCGGMPERKR